MIVPRLVSALAQSRGIKATARLPRSLEFEVRATLQMILGMLVNIVLNDPGPLSLSSRQLRSWLQIRLRRCLGLPDG